MPLPPLSTELLEQLGAAPTPVRGSPKSSAVVPNQFGDRELSPAESMAACGPAAAVAFARSVGRNPTLREAVDLAKQVGWTPAAGMSQGPPAQQQLLTKLGVATHLEAGTNWRQIQADLDQGNPVTVSAATTKTQPGHYFVVSDYDPQSGQYYVGASGSALKGGGEWMTPAQMERLGGPLTHSLYLDNPGSETPSVATHYAPQPAPPAPIDASSPDRFLATAAPYAQQVEQETGIPARIMLGIAANETGYGKSAPGNNFFGIKGANLQTGATFTSPTWEVEGGKRVNTTANFRAYADPADSFRDFADFLQSNPRYGPALQRTSDPEAFIRAVHAAGYATDPNWSNQVLSIAGRLPDDLGPAAGPSPARGRPGSVITGGQPGAPLPAPAPLPPYVPSPRQQALGERVAPLRGQLAAFSGREPGAYTPPAPSAPVALPPIIPTSPIEMPSVGTGTADRLVTPSASGFGIVRPPPPPPDADPNVTPNPPDLTVESAMAPMPREGKAPAEPSYGPYDTTPLATAPPPPPEANPNLFERAGAGLGQVGQGLGQVGGAVGGAFSGFGTAARGALEPTPLGPTLFPPTPPSPPPLPPSDAYPTGDVDRGVGLTEPEPPSLPTQVTRGIGEFFGTLGRATEEATTARRGGAPPIGSPEYYAQLQAAPRPTLDLSPGGIAAAIGRTALMSPVNQGEFDPLGQATATGRVLAEQVPGVREWDVARRDPVVGLTPLDVAEGIANLLVPIPGFPEARASLEAGEALRARRAAEQAAAHQAIVDAAQAAYESSVRRGDTLEAAQRAAEDAGHIQYQIDMERANAGWRAELGPEGRRPIELSPAPEVAWGPPRYPEPGFVANEPVRGVGAATGRPPAELRQPPLPPAVEAAAAPPLLPAAGPAPLGAPIPLRAAPPEWAPAVREGPPRPAYPQLAAPAEGGAAVLQDATLRALDAEANRAAALGDTNRELAARRRAGLLRAQMANEPTPVAPPPVRERLLAPEPEPAPAAQPGFELAPLEAPSLLRPDYPPTVGIGSERTSTALGITDPSQSYDFRYRAAPIDELVTSHLTDSLAPNPAFPTELQPRLRDRATAELQVNRIANDPTVEAFLDDQRALDRGAPIIGADNLVESGNGRTLGLRRARQQNPAAFARYQEELARRAPEFGLRAEDIAELRDPILVRERTTPMNAAERRVFVEEANANAGLERSPVERALSDARNLTDQDLAILRVGDEQTLDQALRADHNRAFVSQFLAGLPGNEIGGLVTWDGRLNLRGVERIKAALFAHTYPGRDGRQLAETFLESTDPLIKNIEHAVFASLPQLAQAEGLTRTGARAADLSLGEDLAKAVNMLARLKESGQSVTRFLDPEQINMFDRELTPVQERLLAHLNDLSRSPRQARQFLREYAAGIQGAPDPRQPEMFGAARQPTREELVDDLIARSRPETSALFGPEAAPGARTGAQGAGLETGLPTPGAAPGVVGGGGQNTPPVGSGILAPPPGTVSRLPQALLGAAEGGGGGAASEVLQAQQEGRPVDPTSLGLRTLGGAAVGALARTGIPRPGGSALEVARRSRRPYREGGLARRAETYHPNSPEAITEAALMKSARSSPDGIAHLSATQVSKLPGAVSKRPKVIPINPKTGKAVQGGWGMPRSIDDIRVVQDAGTPFARWYFEISDGASEVVSRPRMKEFSTLMGVTSQQTPPEQNFGYTLGFGRGIRELFNAGVITHETSDADGIAALVEWGRRQRWNRYDADGNILYDKQGNALQDKWKFTRDQAKKIWNAERHGVAEIRANAKTSSYSGTIGEALDFQYDENATLDTWMAQLHGFDHVGYFANNDAAYRHVQAVTSHLAREIGVMSHQGQAAQWFPIRVMTNDPRTSGLIKRVNQGKLTLSEAVERADQLGIFAPSATDGNIASILANPQIQEEMARSADLWQRQPSPFGHDDTMHLQYPGKAYKRQPEAVRPVQAARRAETREVAREVAPVVHVPDTTLGQLQAAGYDPETGRLTWLGQPHEIEPAPSGNGLQIYLPGGNADLGNFVASGVGTGMDLERVRVTWANDLSPDTAGLWLDGAGARLSDEQATEIASRLASAGYHTEAPAGQGLVRVFAPEAELERTAEEIAPLIADQGRVSAEPFKGFDWHAEQADYGTNYREYAPDFDPRQPGRAGVPGGAGGPPPPPTPGPGGPVRSEGGGGPAGGRRPSRPNLAGGFVGAGLAGAPTPDEEEPRTPGEEALRLAGGFGAGLFGVRGARRAAAAAARGTVREGFAGNIRLEKYPEEVQAMLQRMADSNPAAMEAARRGVVPDAVIRDLSRYSGIDPAKITKTWRPGDAQNAETLVALREALGSQGRTTKAAYDAYREADSSENLSRLLEQVMKQGALQEVVSGVTAEAGRALRSFRQEVQALDTPEQRLEALLKLAYKHGKRDQVEGFLKTLDLNDPHAVADAARTLYNPKLPDLASWLWYNGLLSNPAGRGRDIFSSAVATLTYPAEKLAAVPFDIAQQKLLGGKRSVFAGEAGAEYAGIRSALGDGWRDAMSILRHGYTAEQARGDLGFIAREPGSVDIAGRNVPIPDWLRTTVSAPSRLTAANDAFFGTLDREAARRAIAFRRASQEGLEGSALAARAQQIAAQPDREMLREMEQIRKYRVWQEGGRLNDSLNYAKERLPGARVVIPFTQTPVNLMKYALERSPAGAVMLLGEHAGAAAGFTTKPTRAHTAEMLGRATIGSTIMAGMYKLAESGQLTGPVPPDATDRDAFYRQGLQPYSVRIGDAWHDYRAWGMGPVLGAAAAVHDATQKHEVGDAAALYSLGAVGIAKAMLDQGFMQGLTNFSEALNDPQRHLESFLEGTARSVVPQALQVVARATDPYVRNPQGPGQAITSVLPGLQGTAPPRLGAFGQPNPRPELQRGLGALNPFRSAEVRTDPVEAELARLQRAGYDVEPSMVQGVVQVGERPGPTENVRLTQPERDQYQEIAGKLAWSFLAPTMNDPRWQSWSDAEKEKYIREVVRKAKEQAREQLIPLVKPRAIEQYYQQQDRGAR